MQQGCPIHGDDHMRECSMCGYEFCRFCRPDSLVCSDCTEEMDDDDDLLGERRDFQDVSNLSQLLGEDVEVENIINGALDGPPPADLPEDDPPMD